MKIKSGYHLTTSEWEEEFGGVVLLEEGWFVRHGDFEAGPFVTLEEAAEVAPEFFE